ncbi:hypothetical protein Tco_0483966 [Tanacetum coccineum]
MTEATETESCYLSSGARNTTLTLPGHLPESGYFRTVTFRYSASAQGGIKTLEARLAVLKAQAHRQEWQRQAADDFAVQHIMRTQVLEAGACIDTMEDTGSRS